MCALFLVVVDFFFRSLFWGLINFFFWFFVVFGVWFLDVGGGTNATIVFATY